MRILSCWSARRRIGEAQVDLNRVRSLRRDAVARILAGPQPRSPLRDRQRIPFIGRFLDRLERRAVRPIALEPMDQAIDSKPLERDARLATILAEFDVELTGLNRYERRANSRRRTAIRDYDATCSSLDTATVKKRASKPSEK